MPKEDRSDWVAVAPEFSSVGDKIKPVTTAYQFFQRDVSEQVKAELGPGFKVYEFGRAVKEKWNQLDDEKRVHYNRLSGEDRARFARESHAADVAALERRERLQKERDTLLLDDEGGTQRTTRRGQAKKERKKERKEKKEEKKLAKKKKIRNADDEDFQEEDEGSSDDYSAESDEESTDYDSDDSDRSKNKKKQAKPKRQLSEKQIEYRKKQQEEKRMKENIIAERQEDVRKEKANQAKRRLEFLLKQSNIFSHFGQVKEDQAKYGIKSGAPRQSDGTALSRRDSALDDNDDNQEELDEADEHQATFLTAQPTTLGFGKMRQYQLEGLNWMIRLQENGVNGILADEVGTLFFVIFFFFLRFHRLTNLLLNHDRWDWEKPSNQYRYWCI